MRRPLPLPLALRAPRLVLRNRQRTVRIALSWLRRFADAARRHCPWRAAVCGSLEEVEITLVSDRIMAGLHRDFMGLAGPTDVLTFHHGEIVISAETAQTNARRYRQSLEREIALYTVHGLLHLNGFEDTTSRGAARMRTMQTRLLKACLEELPPPPSL